MRYALGIEYNGHDFHGWQAQTDLYTVQGCLEKALSHIAAEPIAVFCAGRTDTGVHATGQVVHFDTQAKRELAAWVMGVNTLLPSSIAVQWAVEVDDNFHARFSALSRRYRYVIYNHPVRSALLATRVTVQYRPLTVTLMQRAAQYFLGEQDFTSFRSSRCEAKTPIRTVYDIQVLDQHPYIVIEIEANAFLHHMVRNIAGSLMRVGRGIEAPEWIKEVLLARDRRVASETASPCGLYLTRVQYPDSYAFPVSDPAILR